GLTMALRTHIATVLLAAAMVVLVGCQTTPVATISREGDRAPHMKHGEQTTSTLDQATGTQTTELPDRQAPSEAGEPKPQIRRGDGKVINQAAAAAPPPNLGGSSGAATFNFEGESLQAVVKAILGDMLGQNYVIAPGVQGTVTLATPKPVSPAEASSLLEMVLGCNNARMIYSDGRYNIVPADIALAGTVAPRTGSPETARGFESRVVPLRYVSAAEMEKILKPYGRPNAIVSVDSGRNVITVAGTRAVLENYLRTIEIFDVDWMSSMSVGVFPLQSGKATQVVQDLERVFGEQSKSPVAGMFRFMPLEASNSVLVITSQPDYLDDIQQWLERIDGAGAGVQLFSYELKYIKAKDLADRLADVFGGGASSGSTGGMESGMSLNPSNGGNGSVTLEVEGDKVGVSAVDETNTLLVRSTPQAWKSIKDVIERLDVMPLQVHIEAQVAEVTLSGDLKYGVNWYFENALTGSLDAPATAGIRRIAGGTGLAWSFPGNSSLAVINALDQVTDVQLLQTPSVVVRNNAEATLNVGTRIPIQSVTFNP